MFLTNTLSGKLEKFNPIRSGKVGLYVCGLTPYDLTHLGHARVYVTFDIVRRTFEAASYEVCHVQNFTDIDDKIIDRAKARNTPPLDLATFYIEEYFRSIDALGVLRAHQYPRVTQHIPEVIEIIRKLIEGKFAYMAANGDVYYSVSRFGGYGKLSKRKTQELVAGVRVEVSSHKKEPLDFALWKSASGESAGWDSPWGRGRPGWHIECSAMSTKYLGQPFDIHGGGQDLIFPHHENEIAQSESAAGKPFANFFMHNGFVTVNKEKMSKSLGNFFTLKDIYAKFDPAAVRYYLLTEHYRSPLDFSDQALFQAKTALARLIEAVDLVAFYLKIQNEEPLKPAAGDLSDKIFESLTQDFHTPKALAYLQQWAGDVFESFKTKALDGRRSRRELGDFLWAGRQLLGLDFGRETSAWPAGVQELLHQREELRKKKEFVQADAVRQKITQQFGLILEDTPYGSRLKKA
ncbi:MAG: cysteine--tRNA ligase [Elusimicrobia bacterium]|nr:cysteine--tRNA ligase [Elusimicrobiota bacterium]